MNRPAAQRARLVTLAPGDYHVSARPVILRTLLGSCVSACLYDAANGVVGMNHFLLSNYRYPRHMPLCLSDAGRYGIHAMELVINGMMRLGAAREHLRAKAFGGGMILRGSPAEDSFFAVGEVNSRFIREFLRDDGIPLVSADLGGTWGRMVYFDSTDHSVRVKRIDNALTRPVAERDRRFWRQRMENQKGECADPVLW